MSSNAKANRPYWQQTMLRVKDAERSVAFYEKSLGFQLLSKWDFPQWEFSLYFMGTPMPGEGGKGGNVFDRDLVTLELTHNWGEDQPPIHPGNKDRDGFGHIAVAVDDVYAASDKLLAEGVEFKKKPDEGRMKGLAFALDPDGYWVEIVKREGTVDSGCPEFALAQTMLRIKDPSKSIPFYTEQFGMRLLAERHYGKDKGDFSLYFLANEADVEGETTPDPTTPEAMQHIKSHLYPNAVPVLELTHNHGTESDSDFQHNNGNVEPRRGFGHIGFLVDDVYEFSKGLEGAGVEFHKKPDDGSMKGLAFCLDPDGYWIEIINRGMNPESFK
ncbi:lactoylglutathione lyase [Chloropicon primus]|uniref:Lactoylglutathione lyase n=1 Tax=Chloropicon primus TaxID=1764295 RepID=A0A5B8MP13_9CHLO|nr:lactoylglutathione lyase [Chloropicon primus]UPR01271.1 lactoylglutathione lyase [Chloropicon primus]|eukprot:QDZ22051.1 lactoylglutathione lyase [Chloropicon primus]